MTLKYVLKRGLKWNSWRKLVSAHVLPEMSQFAHYIFVVSGLEFIAQFWLVCVSVHGITDKEEVELLPKFALDELLKFVPNLILAHSDNDNNLALLVLRV